MRKSIHGLCLIGRAVIAIVALAIPTLVVEPKDSLLPILVIFITCIAIRRFDLTNIWVAFAIPWLLILSFNTLDISYAIRPVSRETIKSIALVLAIGYLLLPTSGIRPLAIGNTWTSIINDRMFVVIFIILIAFCVLNMLLAGYIPLVRAVTTGDSGYMEFGVKGVYGLFNAFANAFGLTSYYLWLSHSKRKLYIVSFITILVIFILCVTRQNLISLLVESFVICCMQKKLSSVTILSLGGLVLFGFSEIGNFRSGTEISEIAAIRSEYLWLPKMLVWLFAYSYFNFLNLDNVVASTSALTFDGRSLAQLLPSPLRIHYSDGQDLLEVSQFTVNSFISPLYQDVGLVGLGLFFALVCLFARWYHMKRQQYDPYIGDTGCAVMYFCFLFSFFVNFWTYLPVIFQLILFPVFKLSLSSKRSNRE